MYKEKRRHKINDQTKSSFKEINAEHRSHPRFRLGENYKAAIDGSGEVLIKDLSVDGMCLKSVEELNFNRIYKASVFSPENERIDLTGEIVWSYFMGTSEEQNDAPYYESGLKFTEMNDIMKSALENFVEKIITEKQV